MTVIDKNTFNINWTHKCLVYFAKFDVIEKIQYMYAKSHMTLIHRFKNTSGVAACNNVSSGFKFTQVHF